MKRILACALFTDAAAIVSPTGTLRSLIAIICMQGLLFVAGCSGGGSAPAASPPTGSDTSGPSADAAPPASGDESPGASDTPDRGGSGDDAGPQNSPPTADAGTDQSVREGTAVTLAGRATDSDGDALTFRWAQTAGPAVDLADSSAATVTFLSPNVDDEAELSFRLTVTDAAGASAVDDVDVRVLDVEPTAYAGSDQAVSERTEVVLDALGSASWSSIESYAWQQVSGPIVVLDDAGAPRPRFLAPAAATPTTLEFRLTVTEDDGDSATDTVTVAVFPAQGVPDDADRFLTFQNRSRALYDGSEQSARAYYDAIDPTAQKTTLGAWVAANGFDPATDPRAVYRNTADLGFGRVMSLHTRADGSVAAYVENYPTLESAVAAVETGSRAELLATVAMEYSPGPSGGAPFTKFYTFGPDDARITSIDLDGRGAKFVPGLCNVCHGGEPQALVNGIYPDSGHTDAQFLPWDLDTYEFSDTPGYTRQAQEPALKALNAGALSTYPTAATPGSWSGAAARELIEGWYGGPGLPSVTFDGEFVPVGWRAPPNGGPTSNPSDVEEIYLDVVGPSCRACHIMRGRFLERHPEGELIDFATYDSFSRYQAQSIELVFDASEMPDALVTFENFWSPLDGVIAAEKLARHFGVDGIERRPGRPLADPGPSRRAPIGAVNLNGAASRFAETFAWSFAPGGRPAGSGATLSGATTATPTLVTDAPGAYVIELAVGNGVTTSAPTSVSVVSTFGVEPQRFSQDIAPILMGRCAVCHSANGAQSVAGIPVHFDDPATLHESVVAYVDFDDITRSLILTKPSGSVHGGGRIDGFDLRATAPAAARTLSDALIQWISEGASGD